MRGKLHGRPRFRRHRCGRKQPAPAAVSGYQGSGSVARWNVPAAHCYPIESETAYAIRCRPDATSKRPRGHRPAARLEQERRCAILRPARDRTGHIGTPLHHGLETAQHSKRARFHTPKTVLPSDIPNRVCKLGSFGGPGHSSDCERTRRSPLRTRNPGYSSLATKSQTIR
jgi:hypothetical protein